jgi:hypothetical protein
VSLRSRTITCSLLVAAACGAPPPHVDFVVHRTAVVVETDATFAQRPDFPARLESTVAAALRHWGGRWDDLAGTTVTLTGDPYVTCGDSTSALGCHVGKAIRLTTRDPGLGSFSCVEQTVLVHEIGHAVIGDPRHDDPRWMQLEGVSAELGGRPGYDAEGAEVPCIIYVSVWRHVLGIP